MELVQRDGHIAPYNYGPEDLEGEISVEDRNRGVFKARLKTDIEAVRKLYSFIKKSLERNQNKLWTTSRNHLTEQPVQLPSNWVSMTRLIRACNPSMISGKISSLRSRCNWVSKRRSKHDWV